MRPTRFLSFTTALTRHAWIGVGMGLLAVALTSGCKEEYPACKKDKHCNVEEGEKCVDGLCQNCVTDDECKGKGENGEDLTCVEFRCGDGSGAGGEGGPGSEGAPCTSTIECNGGLVCTAGECSKCTEDMQCPDGTCDLNTGLCNLPGGEGGGQCSMDDDCAMDEICDGGMCVFGGDYGGDGEVLCDLQAVFFGFDSPKIQPDVQEQLKTAAACMAEQNRLVYLEAHADPRGTEEYNILLTDKRGQGVKTFLVNLGVPAENMQVISKGSLEAQGTDETSFAQDRRVEFIWQ
jgi:peptidoglycan-associated lipoprotein